MSDILLQHCIAYADGVEQAVLDLGVAEGPLAVLPSRCAAFRDACQRLASNRGLERLTLAFVGPRNAGKTTLASLLVRDPELQHHFPIGLSHKQSTRRVLWVGPEQPSGLDRQVEEWLPCEGSALVDLGMPYQIADVPGFNDRVAEVRVAAERALEGALVQILVVDQRDLEAGEVRQYLSPSDGAAVLPVINRAATEGRSPESSSPSEPQAITTARANDGSSVDPGPSDLAAFVKELKAALPNSTILDPLIIPDFRLRGMDEASARSRMAADLGKAIREMACRAADLGISAGPQLRARLERFRREVARTAREALPATGEAVRRLDQAEESLPRDVLRDVLGPDRALRAVLRQKLRALWLDNTPALFFPWRLVLGAAHLFWGALDRVPLMLMGSVPSLVGAAWSAMRNVRRAADFREALTQGLRDHAARRASEQLAPLIQTLHQSLAADLGRLPDGLPAPQPQAIVDGIGALQERSAAALEAVVEKHAPGRLLAGWVAIAGFALFWVVAGWPLYAVYLDYFKAAAGTWLQAREALRQFPAPSFSVALTAVTLGLLPLMAWLLAIATWVTRRSRVAACARELHLAHERIIRDLLGAGLLRVRLEHRGLAACRRLLSG
jgi:hypothetical protein